MIREQNTLTVAHFPKQPCSRVRPVPFGCRLGKFQHPRRFFERQPNEKPELDEFGLDCIVRRKAIKRFIDGEQLIVRHTGDEFQSVKAHALNRAAVAFGLLAPGIVNKDTPHRFGSGREEVRAILPGRLAIAPEAKPGFVNQRGGLERLAGRFVQQFLLRQRAEFIVNPRPKFVG